MNPLIPALIQSLLETITSTDGTQPQTVLATPAGMLRTIPQNAARATMNPPQQGQVQMDSKLMRLAPGSQIRDEQNRVVLPMAVQQPVQVRYTKDAFDNVQQIWILTQAEAAQP